MAWFGFGQLGRTIAWVHCDMNWRIRNDITSILSMMYCAIIKREPTLSARLEPIFSHRSSGYDMVTKSNGEKIWCVHNQRYEKVFPVFCLPHATLFPCGSTRNQTNLWFRLYTYLFCSCFDYLVPKFVYATKLTERMGGPKCRKIAQAKYVKRSDFPVVCVLNISHSL